MNRIIPTWLRVCAWLLVALWAATITFFSSLTGPQIEEIGIEMWDKAKHFIAFVAGGVLLTVALRWTVDWPWKKLVRVAILALVVFGAIDEIHQYFTPNRSGADPWDWLADALGAVAGVVACVLIHGRFERAYYPASTGD
ncbi:MAG TPA: VanZ family protein [Chthoniobacteraceae bacterium]|nr:VanZ family protein [Chthoniobacteraceae bacterium]